MNTFIIILLVIILFTGFLFFRHLRIQFGFKDSNYARVQHAQRMPKPKEKQEVFLPGSRSDLPDSIDMIAKTMKEGLEIYKFRKKKRKKNKKNKKRKEKKRKKEIFPF